MKISELLREDVAELEPATSIKLLGVLNQLAGRIKDTGSNKKMKLDSLISILSNLGIYVDRNEFIDLAANEPLSDIIADISNDEVSFIGHDEDSDAIKPDQSTSTLEKMAKRAKNKRD